MVVVGLFVGFDQSGPDEVNMRGVMSLAENREFTLDGMGSWQHGGRIPFVLRERGENALTEIGWFG